MLFPHLLLGLWSCFCFHSRARILDPLACRRNGQQIEQKQTAGKESGVYRGFRGLMEECLLLSGIIASQGN